jgi:NAD(P)-dependent dehydrogenase (short-subunit alcohol dehydrogenase family)
MEDLDRLYSKVKAERGSVDVLFANSGFVEHQADSNRPPLTVATSQIRAGGAGFQPTCFECRGIPIALLCYGRLSDRGSV